MVFGGGLLLVGKLGNKTSQPTGETNQSSTPAESTSNQGTGGTVPKEPVDNVTLTNSGFDPKTITVKAGTRVSWLNASGKPGSVNSDSHPTHQLYPALNLGEFPDGYGVQFVFDKPGTYGYHNHLKPSQTGTVIVE